MFNFNMLPSIGVFLVVPGIYLSFLMPKLIKKVSLFSVVAVTPFVIIADYICNFTGQWWVSGNTFPRILRFVFVEDIIFGIFFVYFAIMFYEYFEESRQNIKLWNPRMSKYIKWMSGIFAIFMIAYFAFPKFLAIPYFYFLIGILFMAIPSIVKLAHYPRLFPKFAAVAVYFFFVNFIYEITALKLGQWTFPGTQYIGHISIFGVTFPFEEFIFGFFFYSLMALSYYETFDDDNK